MCVAYAIPTSDDKCIGCPAVAAAGFPALLTKVGNEKLEPLI